MRKVRQFHFTLTINLTDTYGGFLKNCNCFDFSSSMKGFGHCLPDCFTLALLQCLINASGPLITFLRFWSPIPEGGFKSSEPVMQQPHAESYTDSWFCYLWNITGSNPCWIAEDLKGQQKPPLPSSGEASVIPCDPPDNPQTFERDPIQQMYRL